jgi:fused signal recognition particle receptor
MADEKKPGFFKRLFGFGKAEPTPELVPAPEPVVAPVPEAAPLVDEAAERIAREIAEAKAAAEAAEKAHRDAQEKAEAEQRALEDAARKAEADARRIAGEKAAADEAARQAALAKAAADKQAAEQKAEAERLAAAADTRNKAAAEAIAAEEKALKERAEAERIARDKRAAEEAEAARAEAARLETKRAEEAKAEAAKVEAAKVEAARIEAVRIEEARQQAARLEQTRLDEERLEAGRRAAAQAEADRAAAEQAAREQATREEAAREEAARAAAARAAAEQAAAAAAVAVPAPKVSWWQKLKSGLSRTASNVSEGITGLFTKRKLDGETLEELEDLLIQADLGIDVAARISGAVGKGRYDKEIEPEEVKAILAEEVAKVLAPVAKPLVIDSAQKPYILLMVGVNGSGKTTTIGKLASKFRAEGKSVMLAAGDTFRAAAIEQLKVWGERTGATVIAREQGGDAAGLAFDAVKAAREQNIDVLMVDTAGRLQNRTELMAELEKVVRVIKKLDDTAPHGVLLVLDATVGQNALSQVEIFGKTAGVTGLVMTKLDGTARGGILVAIAEKFKMPIHFIGVGEGVDDLEPFAAQDFARAIAGLERLA